MKEILDQDIYIYKNVIKDSDKILENLFDIFNNSNVSWVQATINNHEYNKDLRSCKVFSLYIDKKEYSNLEHVKSKTILNAKINKILLKNDPILPPLLLRKWQCRSKNVFHPPKKHEKKVHKHIAFTDKPNIPSLLSPKKNCRNWSF